MNKDTLELFFDKQLNNWPEAAERYANLDQLRERPVQASGWTVKVVFNPLRKTSVTATPEKQSTRQETCPLCSSNRPAAQLSLDFHGKYTILVNPYPIFRRHFTIIANQHIPQQIDVRFADMLELAREMEGYTVLYNGPGAGASIPYHAHFQAIENGNLPIEGFIKQVDNHPFIHSHGVSLTETRWLYPLYVLTATNYDAAIDVFNQFYYRLSNEQKQMNNLIAWYEAGKWHMAIILRKAHRPDYYYLEGDEQLIISPATVEMGGVIVTIRKEDYLKLDSIKLEDIMRQVSAPLFPDKVSVGILESEEIHFRLDAPYYLNGSQVEGNITLRYSDGKISYNNRLYDSLTFVPVDDKSASIEVYDVVIGKKFHWEQKQALKFRGTWKVIAEHNTLTGINILPIEEYLKSVISSEMSADAPLESLKAHAVISRSWLINQIQCRKSPVTKDDEGLVWYDSSGHTTYNVCADDHCQRYQGITQITNRAAWKAIEETSGEILVDAAGLVADARYSKCCGGIIEEYQYAWDDNPKSYAKAKWDWPATNSLPCFDDEDTATRWVNSLPEAWCNVTDPDIIATTMKSYDQKTPDFFRWVVEYDAGELAAIIRDKTGIDPGELIALVPLKRGKSGRIYKLRIEGSLHSWIIGKELEIRRVLSESHLYSSAFVVERSPASNGKPARFIFRGAGWGHGVGLCQIGAANMAANGYPYKQILKHYYPETQIKKVYD